MTKSISIKIGLFIFAISLIAGLAMDISPVVILKRALASFFVSAILGYILALIIQKYFKMPVKLSSTETGSRETK